jgi:Na+/glutamate symporter
MQFSLKITPTMKWYAISIITLLVGAILADSLKSESAFGLIGFLAAFFSGVLLLGLIIRSVITELEKENEERGSIEAIEEIEIEEED